MKKWLKYMAIFGIIGTPALASDDCEYLSIAETVEITYQDVFINLDCNNRLDGFVSCHADVDVVVGDQVIKLIGDFVEPDEYYIRELIYREVITHPAVESARYKNVKVRKQRICGFNQRYTKLYKGIYCRGDLCEINPGQWIHISQF